MTASFGGHVDTVRTLIEAKAQVNTQEEVHCISVILRTLHTTASHAVLVFLYRGE